MFVLTLTLETHIAFGKRVLWLSVHWRLTVVQIPLKVYNMQEGPVRAARCHCLATIHDMSSAELTVGASAHMSKAALAIKKPSIRTHVHVSANPGDAQ